MKTVGFTVLFVVTVIGSAGATPIERVAFPVEEPAALAEAPSYVPKEERDVHIAGGFFSYFDEKTGSLSDGEGHPAGTIRFVLDELHYESRFVYLPKGTISVVDCTGHVRRFAMERLDYVPLPGTDLPAYRLAGDGAVLVVVDSGGFDPCLDGALLVNSPTGCGQFAVSIRGRNAIDAERRLCKKMEEVSLFAHIPGTEPYNGAD